MTTNRLPTRGYAWYALITLSFINCINYVDRFIVAAITKEIEKPFAAGGMGLTSQQSGWLMGVFFVAYVLAPVTGYLGDRVPRKWIIAGGIFLWSLATVWSFFVRSYAEFVAARAVTGIGEVAYGIIAPAFLADLFDRNSRSRTLSVFYLALPVGTAAGYALGGWIAQEYGWRHGFLVGGAPGLVLAVLAALLREPVRGAMDHVDGADAGGATGHGDGKIRPGAVAELVRNPAFVINVAATTIMTFAIGGLANWSPKFVQEVHRYDVKEANLVFGVVSSTAGALGTIIGGIVADRLQRVTRTALFLMPGVMLTLSAGGLLGTVLATDRTTFWCFAWVTVFLLFANSGPLNAALVNATMPDVRSTAFSVMIFTIHMLGDALSPPLMGFIQDHTQGSAADKVRTAFLISPPLVLAAGLLLVLMRHRLPRAVAMVEERLRQPA